MIDGFAESYAACADAEEPASSDESIKFATSTARELGAKVLATGDYVASRALPGGGGALHCAREAERDQSYFLRSPRRCAAPARRASARRRHQGGDARAGAALGLAVADKHVQPGHLLRAAATMLT